MIKILQFHKMCITYIIITFKCILQLLIMFQPVGKCIIRLARHGFFSYCKMHYLYLCLTRPRDSIFILLTFLNYKSFNLRDRNTFIHSFISVKPWGFERERMVPDTLLDRGCLLFGWVSHVAYWGTGLP